MELVCHLVSVQVVLKTIIMMLPQLHVGLVLMAHTHLVELSLHARAVFPHVKPVFHLVLVLVA